MKQKSMSHGRIEKIARIKRDREERDARLKEKEEIEKVRNMTEEERREWERKNPKPLHQNKQKWKFMQKYYHKGAFFQESADDWASEWASPSKDNAKMAGMNAPIAKPKGSKKKLKGQLDDAE
ncbi:hypothetical protein HU200_066469 [Digitaria exilis]|uniref:Micro-fibrillar-associated protein 1 C-terminal domain-containing protein n=1 Tax=Digitaria exilis TaxID=1010633 RepID=A0A834ZX28_9POAL|nr:hypothetical protein HU200_066469 [Digitaria exilis]